MIRWCSRCYFFTSMHELLRGWRPATRLCVCGVFIGFPPASSPRLYEEKESVTSSIHFLYPPPAPPFDTHQEKSVHTITSGTPTPKRCFDVVDQLFTTPPTIPLPPSDVGASECASSSEGADSIVAASTREQ